MRSVPSILSTTAVVALAAVLVSNALAPPPADAASPRERRFFNVRHGVGAEAPNGWALSLHTGYPNLIAVMSHPNGSRMSISVSETAARDVRELVEKNRRGLVAQKLKVASVSEIARHGLLLDTRDERDVTAVRQAYFVRVLSSTRQAVIVTLTTRAELLATTAGALDTLLSRLVFETPPSSDAAAPSAAADAGA
jgi:hypothetical protein